MPGVPDCPSWWWSSRLVPQVPDSSRGTGSQRVRGPVSSRGRRGARLLFFFNFRGRVLVLLARGLLPGQLHRQPQHAYGNDGYDQLAAVPGMTLNQARILKTVL